jgi:hypothetical protein
MKTRYHIEISRNSLGDHFSETSLNTILKANVRQDKLSNQFGHDYIHFDGNAFEQGFMYIKDQQNIVIQSIYAETFLEAHQALGRLLHSWQDFYSHSNYVWLWMKENIGANPSDIMHNDQQILNSPHLRSGKNYGIMEFIAMIPLLSHIITPLMPEDSHAKLNLDSPKSSLSFPFAYHAALKRSKAVYADIMRLLLANKIDDDNIRVFLGKSSKQVKV